MKNKSKIRNNVHDNEQIITIILIKITTIIILILTIMIMIMIPMTITKINKHYKLVIRMQAEPAGINACSAKLLAPNKLILSGSELM